jgi:ABC-type multidrug transport system fused ATPase/permease subunit
MEMSVSQSAMAPDWVLGGAAADSALPKDRGELRRLLRRHRWQILFTYALFNVENLLRLAQPLFLGWAINGLLHSSYHGLFLFAAGHFSHLLLRSMRQMYDTRTFTRIYADRATELVLQQRGRGIDVSRVAARSALSREFVDFFERHIPVVIRSLYSIIGAVVMLAFFDWVLVVFCLALVVPALILNLIYGRHTLRLSGLLHDDLEREVQIVDRAAAGEVHDHYRRVSGWRIKLSDWEAMTTGVMELFVLALMAGALLRYCTLPSVAAGDIFAVFRYVLLFIMALDSVPMLVQQTSRLRDIGRRISPRDFES